MTENKTLLDRLIIDLKQLSTTRPIKKVIESWTHIILYIIAAILITVLIIFLMCKLFGTLFKKLFRRRNLPNIEPNINFDVNDLPDDEEIERFRPVEVELRGFGIWPIVRNGLWPVEHEPRPEHPREAGGGDNHLRRQPNTYQAPNPQRLTGRGDMSALPFDPAIVVRPPRAQYHRRQER